VTRAHALLDHAQRDGVRGFLTITGGKVTTFRLMAQETVDAACRQIGEKRPCQTETEVLPGSESGAHYRIGERLARKEAHLADQQLVCDCELVARERVVEVIAANPGASIDDIRRRLRLGMGPCQGGFCIYRTAGLMHSLDSPGIERTDEALLDFLQERWKGVWPVLCGDQLRQMRLDEWIYQGVLNVAHLPAAPAAQQPLRSAS
jgi:glycerol-3-phosphate dehydrogenase